MNNSDTLLFISTSSIKAGSILDAVEILTGLTRNIELTGGNNYDVHLQDKLIKIKKEWNINFLIHSYFPPPKKHFILNFADTSERTRGFIKNTIAYVKMLDIDYYSIHAGLKSDFKLENELLVDPGEKHYSLDNIYENVKWFRKEFPDTKLAMENLFPNNMNTETGYLMHIDEIAEFLKSDENTYLLLDLGHLKASSRILDFNYLNAVEFIFDKYIDRVLEIHLSENRGKADDHEIVYSDSIQYLLIRNYSDLIRGKNINVTIEARNYSIKDIQENMELINSALYS